MKVICKCCHKAFDYEMYMGLCPKCGKVYRRGKEHYSAIEKDMAGAFHIHADDGGLNRGIDGVIYNQGSLPEHKILNKEIHIDEAAYAAGNKIGSSSTTHSSTYGTTKAPRYGTSTSGVTGNAVQYGSGSTGSSSKSSSLTGAFTAEELAGMTPSQIAGSVLKNRQDYYSANHGTKLNQGVSRDKNNSSSVIGLIVVIIIIVNVILSFFR